MEYDWSSVPPKGGSFFFVRHDRMNPTMAFRLGNEIFYFGEDLIKGSDTRYLQDLPESTEFTTAIPTPKDIQKTV
jgi:hypothetical protein